MGPDKDGPNNAANDDVRNEEEEPLDPELLVMDQISIPEEGA